MCEWEEEAEEEVCEGRMKWWRRRKDGRKVPDVYLKSNSSEACVLLNSCIFLFLPFSRHCSLTMMSAALP